MSSDKDQFTTWVNEYSDALYSWAFYKVSNEVIAQDLVQETFIAAYKSLDNFKKNSSPKTWLFSILRNKIIDYYRKKIKNPSQSIQEAEEQSFQFTEDLFQQDGQWKEPAHNFQIEGHISKIESDEFDQALENCIEHLPEKWRIAIKAKYFDGQGGKIICKELNISTSNYWQIIHRAKLMLRECLNTNWFDK